MQITTSNKLTLNQEVVRKITDNSRFQAGHNSHNCPPPPSVGFPVCTPVLGAK